MKLYYFKDPAGNFGDDLNAWLWPQLIPKLLADPTEEEILVGIGTLLNHRLPEKPLKHVMGSGAGYGSLPTVDHTYKFHAVRGFETARLLRLPDESVVTDGAVLVRTVPTPPASGSRLRAGAIITGHSLRHYDWQAVCEQAGVHFISCHWPVERVIGELRRCDVILAEAMHGAIVADALRVPWVPIACDDNVLPFKWRDWLSSLQLEYQPIRITSLYGRHDPTMSGSTIKTLVKRTSHRVGIWCTSWGERPRPKASSAEVESAVRCLELAAAGRAFLSDSKILDHVTEELQLRLSRLSPA